MSFDGNFDLSGYEPHWGFGHPRMPKAECPWCNENPPKQVCFGGEMIVSYGNTTYLRAGHNAEFVRNGDYIDIWFDRDGRREWIAISVKNLRQAIALLTKPDETSFVEFHGRRMSAVVEFDEPANAQTSLVDFLRSNSIRELLPNENPPRQAR